MAIYHLQRRILSRAMSSSTTAITPKLNILISGAGIAGPCLAYWLGRSRLNANITVLERAPIPRVTGQSLDIHDHAVEIVKKMKLEEAIRELHTKEEGTRILKASGKPMAQFDVGEVFTANYEILRADLAGLFLDASREFKNVNYVFGDYVKTLSQQSDTNAVDVEFAKGSKATYDLVVAADGASSQLRNMFLDEETRRDSYNFLGQYIAFFSIPREKQDPNYWQVYNAPKGFSVMTRPHRNGTSNGAYMCITQPKHGVRDPVVEAAIDAGPAATKKMMHDYFKHIGWETPRILAAMDKADDFYMARIAQVKLPKWTNGRCVCIGDAAFATFGVGTTLAVESAYLLAGELSKVQSSADIPAALEMYEEVFRPLYKQMEDLPPFFPQFAFPQTAVGLTILRSAAWVVQKTKIYKLFMGGGESGVMKWKLPEYEWSNV